MEVEDPISARFRSLIEALMAKTTSEIVKAFVEVLLETRVEISRSWREIDELKQKLEEIEEQRAEAVSRCETAASLKREKEELLVSRVRPQISVSDASTVRPVVGEITCVMQTAKDGRVDNIGDVVVHKSSASQTTSVTSGINPSVNSPDQSQETQVPQTVVKRKRGRPVKSSKVTEPDKHPKQTDVVSKSPLQAVSVLEPQQPSSSTGIIILSKNRGKKGAVVTKKKYIQKKFAFVGSVSTPHTLRDRHSISSQRPCLCCPLDKCSLGEKQQKINPQTVSQAYTCRKCGKMFHEWMQFNSHKCSILHECNRCGQSFKTIRNLATHRQSIQRSNKPFLYCCYLCGHMFSTKCGWNMHKRIHAHYKLPENTQQSTSKPSQPVKMPKELKAKLEVRLERISDAQLEAALCPKGALIKGEQNSLSSLATGPNFPSALETSTCIAGADAPSADTSMNKPMSYKDSGSQTKTKAMKQPDEKIQDPAIPTVSGQIQPTRKENLSESLPVPSFASVECEEGSSGGSEGLTKGLNSLSRKRKMSECNHDVYNGVFPVEKILRWRNTKGRNEVRVKWMPCSLCGAKWKNTWEPAESFTSYKDTQNEDEN